MKLLLLLFAALLGSSSLSAQEIKIKVNASQRIATSSPLFNGTNISFIGLSSIHSYLDCSLLLHLSTHLALITFEC